MNAATHDMLTDCRTPRRPATARPPGFGASIRSTIGTWRTRIRDRQAFANLDYRDIRDMRLSRWELGTELAKPFWRG